MDAGPHSAASASAPRRQSKPFNFMPNNDMHAATPAAPAVRRSKRVPELDSNNATIQEQGQGWVGVQYYSHLLLNQEDDADESLSSQTHGDAYIMRPPMVQHAAVPLHRRRSTSAAMGALDHGTHHHVSEQGRGTAADKRHRKSLAALFEKEIVGSDRHPSQSSSQPRQACENMDPRYRHHQSQLHPHHPHHPQESAAFSLLKRGEKRPLSASSSSLRYDAKALPGAPVPKRGRSNVHGDHATPIGSQGVTNDKSQHADSSSQYRQKASSAAAAHPAASIEIFSGDGQPQVSIVVSLTDTRNRQKDSQQSTKRQTHQTMEQPLQDQRRAAEHIEHTTPVHMDPEQPQDQEMANEGEAEDVMMDVDAGDEDQSIAIEQEQVQNEIRVFERTFPGLADQYKVLDKIGEGTFSYVYKAIDLKYNEYSNSYWDYGLDKKPYRMCYGRDYPNDNPQGSETPGKLVAIKRITVASSPQRLESEISILKELTGSKHVAPLITAFRHRDQVVVVLPFYPHDDYREYFRRLPLDDIRWYFRALFSALAHIHKHGIIHRDIKPTNFLYDTTRKTGILVDFGLAQREDQFEPYHYPSKYKSSVPPVAPSTPAAASAGGVAGGGVLDAMGSHQPPQANLPGGGLGTAPADLLRPNKPPSQQQPIQPAASMTATASATTTTLSSNREPGYLRRDPRPMIKVNRAGTRGFRSPEILFRHVKQTVALDVWAAGAILISFLSGRFPFFHAIEDADALIELAVLYGNAEMKKVAATFNRTFVTTVPTVREEGVQFLRVCRLLHPGRFGVPWWFDTKLPLKVQKAACVRNVAQLRSQLEKLINQLKGRDGGGPGQKEKESRPEQQQAQREQQQQQQPTKSSESSIATGKELSDTAPGATAVPTPPLTQEQKLALQDMIIATKAKISDISQMYQLIVRHQQKFHSSAESKRSSSSSQKSSSSSSRQVADNAAPDATAAPPQGTPNNMGGDPSYVPQGQSQRPQEDILAHTKTATDKNANDKIAQGDANKEKLKRLVNTLVNKEAPEDMANKATGTSFATHIHVQPLLNNGPRPSHSMQPPALQDPTGPTPSASHRKQNTTGSYPKTSSTTPSSSSSFRSSSHGSNSDRAYTFGWDSQEGLEDAVDLLQKLLCLDPAKRITAEDALKHKFLATYTPQQLQTYRAFKEEYFRQDEERRRSEQGRSEQATHDANKNAGK
ncbi:hypothetical protein BGZ73_002576 [Actinomortierella ambigua]|nr:hypothetical protein BGZ73_002576 [Actinomortierella ambigua]